MAKVEMWTPLPSISWFTMSSRPTETLTPVTTVNSARVPRNLTTARYSPRRTNTGTLAIIAAR
jgi:hypothetical protein